MEPLLEVQLATYLLEEIQAPDAGVLDSGAACSRLLTGKRRAVPASRLIPDPRDLVGDLDGDVAKVLHRHPPHDHGWSWQAGTVCQRAVSCFWGSWVLLPRLCSWAPPDCDRRPG